MASLSVWDIEDCDGMAWMDDKVGKPIWPQALKRMSGEFFFTVPQLAREVGIPERQAQMVVDVLVQEGLVQPWHAPQCPNCDSVWAAYLGEDDIPKSIHCPFCGEATPEHFVDFYLVYERLKTLE